MLGRAFEGKSMSRLAVLIVAAGKGERAGTELPKQYEQLAGRPMLRRTVEAFFAFDPACRIQVVIGAGQQQLAASALAGLDLPPAVPGGATRQESGRWGLDALSAAPPDHVLTHDAARPLISASVIGAVIAALEA